MKRKKKKIEMTETPDWYLRMESSIIELTIQQREISDKLSSLRDTVQQLMVEDGLESIKTDMTSVYFIHKRKRRCVDYDFFKKAFPEIYHQVVSEEISPDFIQIHTK